MSRLGAVTGHRKTASALAKRMKARIARAVASAPKRRLTVYHELTHDFYSATSSTFIGRIYKLFGLRNIADAADGAGPGSRSSRPSTSRCGAGKARPEGRASPAPAARAARPRRGSPRAPAGRATAS
ncbi:MAG: hypothetical protein E6G22_01590 [Actinobacteria bacterium]|nr:MAG: hypothetical protein E6G22_01590 [Actinomycetota bacterium]